MIPVALMLALTGCSGSEPQQVSPPPSRAEPFTLAVTPTPKFDTVSVNGTSNLPDGTIVTVQLSRNVTFEGEDARSFHAGGEGVPVRAGKFRADIDLDERLMTSSVIDQSSFGPLETISDTVSVCAQVRPNKENETHQPEHVQQALGDNGANLASSPQTKKFGGGYWLEVISSADLPSPSLGAIEAELGEVKTVTDSAKDLFCVS